MLESVDSEHWKHHQRLLILEFIPLDDDACVYTKGQGKEMNSLIVHVDNPIIAAPSDAETPILASWKWSELEDAAEILKEWNRTLSIAFHSSQREELADEFNDHSSDLRVLISTYVDTMCLDLHEGGSVDAAALTSGNYKIRGVTRDINSDASKALVSKGVEMVAADWNDEQCLVKAFKLSHLGSYAIYTVPDFWASFATQSIDDSIELEAMQGINMAKDAAKTASLQHFIWSTIPNNVQIPGGKHSVAHFEGKLKVDQFIKQDKDLLSKTPFILLKASGKYLQLLPVPEDCPITTVGDPRIKLSIYAVAIWSQPKLTLPGKIVLAESETRTVRDIVNIWSEVSGKPAEYSQIPIEHYDNLWPKWGREIGQMLQFWNEAREKSWTSDHPVLTKHDLGVSGLIDVKEVFAGFDWPS
ncbi:hypothetical protein N7499_007442 [Penicillium canescens]|nr:hypothetical protein N7499_007442 [Penicillium canescens]